MARFRLPGRSSDGASPNGNGVGWRREGLEARARSPATRRTKPRRPRLRKLRIALVFFGLAILAFISWIFGIMMAVASDLPQLEDRAQFQNAQNSVVYDINGNKIATLTNNQGRILVPSVDIAPVMKEATVAIEDSALLPAPRRRLPGDRPCRRPGRAPNGRRAGRVDDHRAVRQERAARPEQPDHLREASRGRSCLPARAPLGQGQDPHRVPERDLLRQRRLRDRGGRQDLLRLQPPRLRQAGPIGAPATSCPGRRPCSPA